MKPFDNVDLLRTPAIIKVLAFASISFVFFYLGKHWSESDGYGQLIFFSSSSSSARRSPPSVALSPNFNKSFDVSSLVPPNQALALTPPPGRPSQEGAASASPRPPPPTPPPPPPEITRFGIVDENGKMTDDFEVGEFDPEDVDEWTTNATEIEGTGGEEIGARVKVQRYELCPDSMREYIPCLDNVEAIKRLNSTERGERFERHCPKKDKGLN